MSEQENVLGNGFIITMEAPGGLVSCDAVRQHIKESGLDIWFPPEVDVKTALRRTANHYAERKSVVRRVPGERPCYQVTLERLENGVLVYQKDVHIWIGSLARVETDAGNEQVAEEIRNLYASYVNNLTGSDIMAGVRQYLDSKSDVVPLRSSGGAYWIPPTVAKETLTALSEFMSKVGGRLYVFELSSDEQNKANVAESLAEYLSNMIADWRQSIKDVQLGVTRASTIGARSAEINDIFLKLQSYKVFLGNLVTKLHKEITEGLTEFSKRLTKPNIPLFDPFADMKLDGQDSASNPKGQTEEQEVQAAAE